MSYLALYRKYRPTSFDDLVGQNDVANIIKNEIINNKISHAYLFSGPRGTGKTSTAKIIAKMVNCYNLGDDGIPCGECECCKNPNNNDVVEIDAASNNGVDEIRDLRDKVNLVPSIGKYKIYIIDEVHMLTTQAFNALLKTLEEPPSHAIFILATTEFYKIPATVVSRCQKFQFLRFSNDEIVDRLKNICNLENIEISEEILVEIARLSEGGLRDAINMLDQLSSFKSDKIEIDDVYMLNGVVSYHEIADLFVNLKNNQISNIISFINDINKKGKNIDRFICDCVDFLKDVLIYKNTGDVSSTISEKKDKIIEVSNLYELDNVYNVINSLNDLSNRIKNSNFSIILLISYFVKQSSDLNAKSDVQNISNTVENIVRKDKIKEDKTIFVKKNDSKLSKNHEKSKKIRINNAFTLASKDKKDKFIDGWSKKDSYLTNYDSIVGIVDDIDVLVVADEHVIFLVKYDSLIDRIYNYLNDFERLLLELFDVKYKVVFLANDEWNYEKNKYIKNIKDGYKYQLMVEEESLEDTGNSNIDKIISILGNDVISYK